MDSERRPIAAAQAGRIPTVPIVGLAALWLAMLLVGFGHFDHRLVVAVHVGEQPALGILLFLTTLGDWEILVAATFFAAAWLLLSGRRWRLAGYIIGWTLLGRLLIIIQKTLLGRLRPDDFDHPVVVNDYAFPSGHAGNSMIVYLLLALLLVRDDRHRTALAAGAVLLSLAIGTSRVLLGVHWPSDVVGGWSFGLLWVLLGLALAQRLALNAK